MTGTAKLAYTALLFAIALGLLGAAAATHSAVPLFFMWLPLLGVMWILARPERGASPSAEGISQSTDPGDRDQEPSAEP
jgi:hypothetical protein